MKNSKVFFRPTRSRRDIRENSKTPTYPHKIRKKKTPFPIKVNFGGDNAEDTRRASI